jgi:FkbM family methyltransferase
MFDHVALPLGGRKYSLALKLVNLLEPHAGEARIVTPFGPLRLDRAHPPERVLTRFFPQLLEFYRRSELGRFIAANLAAADVFLDAGANLGMYSLLAREAGAEAILIEPEPRHGAFLRRNAEVFGRIVEAAAYSESGRTMHLFDSADEAGGGASLLPWPDDQRAVEVATVTLSEVISACAAQGSRLRLIKLDVEGAEASAVQGLDAFLDSHSARPVIWCEVRGDTGLRGSGSAGEVAEILARHGYEPCEARAGRAVPFAPRRLAAPGVFDLRFEVPSFGGGRS